MIDVGSRSDLSRSLVRSEFPEFAATEGADLYSDLVSCAGGGYPPADLVAALRTMTLCEAEFRLPGGSVSPVIWLFRTLKRRDRDAASDLADWIMDNRGENPWIPFGTPVYRDLRSPEQRAADARIARERTAKARSRQAAQDAKSRAKAERLRKLQAHRLEERPRSDQIRERRIAEVRRHPDACVQAVIAASETVDYWPPSVAEECRLRLSQCTAAELHALLAKIRAGARSAHWRALKQPVRHEVARRISTVETKQTS